MSKILLWTDLHFYPHKRQLLGTSRIDDCIQVVDWVFKTAKDKKIKNIIFGGDFFHDRHKMEVFNYQKGFESIYKWLKTGEFNLYMLIGNHDMWFFDKTNITSVYAFQAMTNCTIIPEAEQIEIEGKKWDFIPFSHNPLEDVKKLKKSQGDYAVGHLAIDGAVLHGNTVSDVVIEHEDEMVVVDKSIFSGYKKVFLGHYHIAQKLDSVVEYIGSPLELSFGEANQEKHIIVFDTKDNSTEYVINDFSPKHIVVKDIEKIDKVDYKNNFIKLFVDDTSATDVVETRNKIYEDTRSLEVARKKVIIQKDVIDNAKDILYKEEEMLEKWLKEKGHKGLDETKLLDIGKKLCKERIVV